MDIEIEIVGSSNKWVLNQPLIRIGRGAKCELALPAKQYPTVAVEHVALEVLRETVRLAGGSGSPGDTYLNDRPAAAGTAVHTGDILRLGAAGPELRIRFPEREPQKVPMGYEPTRLMRADEAPVYEPTRVVSVQGVGAEPTVRIPSPGGAGNKPPAQPAAPSSAGSGDASYSPFTTSGASRAASGPKPGEWRDKSQDRGKQESVRQTVSVAAQSAAAAAAGIGSPDMRNLEGRLKTMQIILLANLAILVVVLAWAFQLNRQLSQNRDELRELRMQAQTAVSQFTPELDAKLGGFDKRMSGLDDELKAGEEHMENGIAVRMKLAQDQLFTNLDAKMKSTEERMVNRMDTEIPSMLDKYINKKLTELKH